MANVRCGNSSYCDSTGLVTATGDKNIKVSFISFTSDAAADSITFKDSGSGGALKLTIKAALADETVFLDYSLRPLLFPNGVYVSAISANCTATIVFTTGGGD